VSPGETALDASWRARSQAAQEQAVPLGRVVVSCPAPLGAGGLGRHLQEVLEALGRCGAQASSISDSTRKADPGFHWSRLLKAGPLLRRSPSGRVWITSARFDAYAAGHLPAAEHVIAFNGTARAQFRAARRKGYESRVLVSANSHVEQMRARHELAYSQYPVERPWSRWLVGRNRHEYASADEIYVASDYIWESFVERGVPAERLARFPLTPDARFAPAPGGDSSAFEIVYVGSLVVHKGVPLLLDAFARLQQSDMRLVLVGGWKTPSMRRLIEGAQARDARIVVAPGDPLPHLRRASVCVHPAYEDGFGYAPAEALAAGVPLIVSEDTGMKELLAGEREGLVLPTGDRDALVQALEAAYRGEVFGG
jgi:glycosyltransferase involved in cell wall biosynthesis